MEDRGDPQHAAERRGRRAAVARQRGRECLEIRGRSIDLVASPMEASLMLERGGKEMMARISIALMLAAAAALSACTRTESAKSWAPAASAKAATAKSCDE